MTTDKPMKDNYMIIMIIWMNRHGELKPIRQIRNHQSMKNSHGEFKPIRQMTNHQSKIEKKKSTKLN